MNHQLKFATAPLFQAYLGIPYWLPTAKRSKTRSETMLSLVLVGTAEGQLIVADAPDWLHLPLPVNIERGMVKDMVRVASLAFVFCASMRWRKLSTKLVIHLVN